jgi:hypothetical protein
MADVKGTGTKQDPWILSTPSGGSEIQAYRDETANPPALVIIAQKTEVRYHLRVLTDMIQMLKAHGDWMELGSTDEQKPAKEGTVEGARRQLHPARAGSAGHGGSRAQGEGQPDAGGLEGCRITPPSPPFRLTRLPMC